MNGSKSQSAHQRTSTTNQNGSVIKIESHGFGRGLVRFLLEVGGSLLSSMISFVVLLLLMLALTNNTTDSSTLMNDIRHIYQVRRNAAIILFFTGALVGRLLRHHLSRLIMNAKQIRQCLVFFHWLTRQVATFLIVLLLLLHMVRYHYQITLRPLFRAYRWNEANSALAETYYQRDCTREDLSTINMADLIVPHYWDATKAAENILTHGASVFPSLVDRETLDDFRNFTLARNSNLNKNELVYVMKAFKKKRQTRWAFAFTAHDHPSVPKVLRQIVANDKLRQTLELFLGPDPAVIKMQTITSIRGAEHQGWHPDLSAFSSAKSYARNFMMHFSLFIPLQDTTPRMGATGVCPGTQYCANVDRDIQKGCGQVFSGNENGVPIWYSGDAVLMNQNTWHRGWEHTQSESPRAIIVITFTSRPRTGQGTKILPTYTPLPTLGQETSTSFEGRNASSSWTVSSMDAKAFPAQSWQDEARLNQAETRTLSLGTPLTSFGHTMDDLWNPEARLSTIQTSLRYLGLYKPRNAHWGWDFVTSMFSRIASEGHLYKEDDLGEFIQDSSRAGGLRNWAIRHVVYSSVPVVEEDEGVWDVWYSKSMDKATMLMGKGSKAAVAVYVALAVLLAAFLSIQGEASCNGRRETPSTRQYRIPRQLAGSFWMLAQPIAVGAILIWIFHWRFETSSLVREIKSGHKVRTSFPNLTATLPTGTSAPISLVPMSGTRLITHGRGRVEFVSPHRNDVLIATRLNSLYLRIVNCFLDYHTGNIAWRRAVRETAHSLGYQTFQACSETVQNAIVETIVSSTKGRFLLQSPEMGNYTLMTTDDSLRFTRRALLLEYDPLLFALDQSANYMISQLRFESPLRGTPLTIIAAGVLDELRSKMFGEKRARSLTVDAVSTSSRATSIRRKRNTCSPFVVRPFAAVLLHRSIKESQLEPRNHAHTKTDRAASSRSGRNRLDAKRLMTASRRKRRQRS